MKMIYGEVEKMKDHQESNKPFCKYTAKHSVF